MAWFLPLLVAPFVGSALGTLVQRLPRGRPIALVRSACESCGRALGPLDLVPIASYVALGGKCRSCRSRIAPFHLWIELAALGVAASAVLVEADPGRLWAGCCLGWTLLALAWIDCEHMLLPDVLTLPLVLAGLAATWLLSSGDMADHAIGAAVGYAAFRAIAVVYQQLRGRSGLGQGDAKLLAAAGAWVGWEALPAIVLLAALAGLGAALVAAIGGRRLSGNTALPFGPFLAGALWICWLGGSG